MIGQIWPQGAPMSSAGSDGPVVDVDFTTLPNLDDFTPTGLFPNSKDTLSLANGYLETTSTAQSELTYDGVNIYNGFTVLEGQVPSVSNATIRSLGRKLDHPTENTYLGLELAGNSGVLLRVVNNAGSVIQSNSSGSYTTIPIWLCTYFTGPLISGFITSDDPFSTTTAPSVRGFSWASIGHNSLRTNNPGLVGFMLRNATGIRVTRFRAWSLD